MIMVTPFIAQPMNPGQVARPDDGFVDSHDGQALLLGRLNGSTGSPGAAARQGAASRAGTASSRIERLMTRIAPYDRLAASSPFSRLPLRRLRARPGRDGLDLSDRLPRTASDRPRPRGRDRSMSSSRRRGLDPRQRDRYRGLRVGVPPARRGPDDRPGAGGRARRSDRRARRARNRARRRWPRPAFRARSSRRDLSGRGSGPRLAGPPVVPAAAGEVGQPCGCGRRISASATPKLQRAATSPTGTSAAPRSPTSPPRSPTRSISCAAGGGPRRHDPPHAQHREAPRGRQDPSTEYRRQDDKISNTIGN